MMGMEQRYRQQINALAQAMEVARQEADEIIEELRKELAVMRVSRIVARERVEDMVRDESLPDDKVGDYLGALKEWSPDDTFEVGDVRSWDGDVWICQIAHAGQEDWSPGGGNASWAIYRQSGALVFWVQPDGAGGPNLPFAEGDRVIHVGRIWRSMVPDNVWEPGTDENLWEDEGEWDG